MKKLSAFIPTNFFYYLSCAVGAIQKELIGLRTCMVEARILESNESLLFTARGPGATILIALNVEEKFYHSDVRGSPRTGSAYHSTVRQVIIERWPGIKPTVRDWIRVFNDFTLAKCVGMCFLSHVRIVSCSHVWQASSLISSLWIATPRGRCLGIHRLTTQRQWRMMHLPIGLVRVSRHAPGHRQQVCQCVSFGDTPADQGGTAMDQAGRRGLL